MKQNRKWERKRKNCHGVLSIKAHVFCVCMFHLWRSIKSWARKAIISICLSVHCTLLACLPKSHLSKEGRKLEHTEPKGVRTHAEIKPQESQANSLPVWFLWLTIYIAKFGFVFKITVFTHFKFANRTKRPPHTLVKDLWQTLWFSNKRLSEQ